MQLLAGLRKVIPPRRSHGLRLGSLGWAGGAAAAVLRGSCALALLSLALPCGGAEERPQQATYNATLREYLAQQDRARSNELYQLQRAADGQRRQAFEEALTEHLHNLEEPTPSPSQPAPEHATVTWAVVAALFLVLALRVLLPRLVACFTRRFDPWAALPTGVKASDLPPHLLAEDPAWVGFVRAMEEGLKSVAKDASAPHAAHHQDSEAPGAPHRFFETAPQQLATLRTLFAEFSRAAELPPKPAKVLELLRQVQAFKESAAAPELLPVRQLTAAMVGLLTQLSKQPANVTPSTLRTLAAALDLLQSLCVRGVRPNLASEPPVRLLAVDDEPLTRALVSRALQKVFSVPHLASSGSEALAQAKKQAYDLIFLDVEMPGMDGFELCQQLHQASLNAATPVIFVTRHSDFHSRAKSTLHGAQDLIAKPFLAFELALKALTLILRTRLTAGSTAPEAAPAPAATTPRPVETTANAALPPPAPAVTAQEVGCSVPERREGSREPNLGRLTVSNGGPERTALPEPLPATLPLKPLPPAAPASVAAPQVSGSAITSTSELPAATKALLAQAGVQFQTFRDQLSLVREAVRPEEINALVAKFYPTVAAFSWEAYCAKLNAAFRLGSALEAMLKKLLEKPKLRPPSTLESVGLALDVLIQLAQSGKDVDLDQSPARLLVVDDDPLARRMMGEALQLAFGRPESADSGEAALALASTKPFDLVYLDVLMPGMDGFATCAKMRRSATNRNIPVMFVTSQNDLESRNRATASGGSGFIAKPTLPCEITLVTVSLLLRNRLVEATAPLANGPLATSKEDKPVSSEALPRKQRRHPAARERRHDSLQSTPPPEPALKS